MVWTHRDNGWVPYGQKGVDGGSKWRSETGSTEVRLDRLFTEMATNYLANY